MCHKRELIDLDEVQDDDDIEDIEVETIGGDTESSEPEDPMTDDEEYDDDSLVVSAREDDLQQIMADMVLELLGERQIHTCVEDYGLDSDDLMALLDVIEDFLAMHAVFIDHPVISMGCDGNPDLYPSIYETPDMMS